MYVCICITETGLQDAAVIWTHQATLCNTGMSTHTLTLPYQSTPIAIVTMEIKLDTSSMRHASEFSVVERPDS